VNGKEAEVIKEKINAKLKRGKIISNPYFG
jgi:hypothetical protein